MTYAQCYMCMMPWELPAGEDSWVCPRCGEPNDLSDQDTDGEGGIFDTDDWDDADDEEFS